MKKKLFAMGVSVVLAAAMCVGFAACGDNAESATGEQVSREVWEAAFSDEAFSNLKVELEMEQNAECNEIEGYYKVKEIIAATMIREGDKVYAREHVKGHAEGFITGGFPRDIDRTVECYCNGDTLYSQNKEGKWEQSSDETAEIYLNPVEFFSRLSSFYKNRYDEFVYSAEKKGYVFQEYATQAGREAVDEAVDEGVDSASGVVVVTPLGAFELYVLKFQDGKLAYMSMNYSASSETGGAVMTDRANMSFTYGGQKVTLPEIALS